MSVKDRILKYLNSKGVAITKAEALLGWSKGALLKANSISSDRLGEFILQYPEINVDWLLTGKGPMLKTDQLATVQQSGRSANYQGTFTEPINTIMGSGNSIGGSAREKMAELKRRKLEQTTPEATELRHEVERLKAEVEHLKTSLELKDTVIQAKDDLIKLLSEKK